MNFEVPDAFKNDYLEACAVLDISAKASAALSRRVLESILDDQQYSGNSLDAKIDSALKETDVQKVLPPTVRRTIHAVRNLGNFAAHPTRDKIRLEVIDVEPDEAEWCLEIIEGLLEHYYGITSPQIEDRKAKLSTKLADAGKPNKIEN